MVSSNRYRGCPSPDSTTTRDFATRLATAVDDAQLVERFTPRCRHTERAASTEKPPVKTPNRLNTVASASESSPWDQSTDAWSVC